MITVKQMKEEIRTLPPFRETVLKARERMSDPSTSAAEIAEILQYDAGITANILRLCNSPYYGLRGPVRELQQAVAYLGNRELQEILILSGCMDYFQGERPGYEGQYGELWRHSIASAVLAKKLGVKFANGSGHFFIAGLLHDVGKLVLSEYVEDKYQEILTCIEIDGLPFHLAEKRVLGMHHGEVGALILQYWNFPEEIVSAATTHHSEDINSCSRDELIIALADRLSSLMGTGTLIDSMHSQGIEHLCEYFGMGWKEVEQLLSQSSKEVGEIIHSFVLEPER